MKYINPNSRSAIANKFADAVMLEIGKNGNPETLIKVTVYPHFFVVNGYTSSNEAVDLNVIKDSFFKENEILLRTYGYKSINIIDLITYNSTGNKKPFQYFDFYQSLRPLYHEKVLNLAYNSVFDYDKINYTDRIVLSIFNHLDVPRELYFERMYDPVISEFPYGYSLNNGRVELYYCEYIANQLFSPIKATKAYLLFEDRLDEDTNDVMFDLTTDSPYLHESVKSMVLDVFDFDLTRFQTKYLKNYDLSKEIDNQISEKPWLVKDKTSELFII